MERPSLLTQDNEMSLKYITCLLTFNSDLYATRTAPVFGLTQEELKRFFFFFFFFFLKKKQNETTQEECET